MFEQPDTGKLIEEIGRYLVAVDLFRTEKCEPTWRPEPAQEAAQPHATLVATPAPDVELHIRRPLARASQGCAVTRR